MANPMVMSPRQFAKITGVSEHVIREKCKLGLYPHTKEYTANGRPYVKVLVEKTIAIIEKECINNAPFMAKEKQQKSKAVSIMSQVLKTG